MNRKRSCARIIITCLLIIMTMIEFANSQETLFFLVMGDGSLAPSYLSLANVTRMECTVRCGQDANCNAFNLAPSNEPIIAGQREGTGDCSLLTITYNTTKVAGSGTEIWMKRSYTGGVRIDMDGNGNIFAGFRVWETISFNETERICTVMGGRIASFTSMAQARFYQRLLNDGNTNFWVFSGMTDNGSNSLFTDSRGLEPPEDALSLNGLENWPHEPCLALVLPPLGSDPFTDDNSCSDKNPWICEFPRIKDVGCFVDPPVPLGAEIAPGTSQRILTGSTVSFVCSSPGETFVNGGQAPTATCRSDGYWTKSAQFFPCTGGPGYLKDSATGACYTVNKGRLVSVSSAEKYCRSLGGTVLTYSDGVKWIFDGLMDNGTGGYDQAFAGYIRNTTTGYCYDVYGNVTSMLPWNWNDDDSDPNHNYIYVQRSTAETDWTFYDFHEFTATRRFICKFLAC